MGDWHLKHKNFADLAKTDYGRTYAYYMGPQ